MKRANGGVLNRNKARKRAKRVYTLSNDEEPDYTGWTKQQIRREKNRRSAKLSRDRQNLKMKTLESNNQALTDENKVLREKVKALELELNILKSKVSYESPINGLSTSSVYDGKTEMSTSHFTRSEVPMCGLYSSHFI